MNIITFENVSFEYASADRLVLEDISFNIKKGELNIIMGASGSGKTTLIRLMKEKTAPAGRSTGVIENKYGHAGFVSQEPDNQLVMDTVWHELAFGLENTGLDSDSIRKRVAEMAEYMGISGMFEKHVEELSGGQKQLLNLAAVMVMQPDVLLLDEPTAQLDPPSAKKFLQTVIELNQELGVTVVMVEHHLENIFDKADNVMLMEAGKLTFAGKPREAVQYIIGSHSHLIQGLPCAVRIAKTLSCNNFNSDGLYAGKLPISVREGRSFVHDYFSQRNPHLFAQNERNAFKPQHLAKDREIVIKAENLGFAYKKGGDKVINRLDLQIEKGHITALLGGNGAGKSTFLKLCAGVYKPVFGKLKVSGRVRLLPQDVMSVFTEISVEEELAEVVLDKRQACAGLSLQQKKEKVEEMLEKMDLQEHRNKHPYDLSGGQKQKLAIGKMLLMEPDILLLDEPTKGLDPFFKNELGTWLNSEAFSDITVIIVTHDVDFAAEFADECGLLFNGGVVSIMDTHSFFAGNMFFTTNVNRIMGEYFPKCVSVSDVEKLVAKEKGIMEEGK